MSRLRPLLPALAWMGVIFLFSSSLFGAEETGTLFRGIIRLLYPAASPDTVEAMNFAIRKTAHFTEYAVLALLWSSGLRRTGRDALNSALLAFIISAAYAASDELHQSFVPGRTASFMDVLLDCSGAAAACLALLVRHKKSAPQRGARLGEP